MTPAKLQEAEAAYRAALAVSEEARNQRNAAIYSALLAGMTHAAIAEATGLTRGRIGQMATAAKVIRCPHCGEIGHETKPAGLGQRLILCPSMPPDSLGIADQP